MRSGFFNSNIEDYDEYGNPIYDRAEEASFFAEFFASFIGNGVYPNPSTGMQVLANSGMNLKIQPGKCFINGYFGLVEEGGEIITIEPADENYSRIDRIVARWDLELRKIIPYVLKGTPASKPVAPELTRNSNIYEIALADVSIKANTTVITQANITDRRLDTSLCGVVVGVVQQLDTTTLFNQYQVWFEEKKQKSDNDYQTWFEGFTIPSEEEFIQWFERMKGQLTEDAAGNLQLQIDNAKNDIANKVDKIAGKGLSTHDFNSGYKTKLDGIEDGANKTITKTATAKTHTNYPTDNAKVPDMAFMTFWNGAYNSPKNNSNLTYCHQGEIQAKPTVLYSNAAGSAGTITLSQSAANFNRLKIFAVRDGTTANTKENTCTEVYLPNGKNAGLYVNHATDTLMQFYGTRVNINGTSITHVCGNYMGANKSLGVESYNNNEHLKIVAVLGYK